MPSAYVYIYLEEGRFRQVQAFHRSHPKVWNG